MQTNIKGVKDMDITVSEELKVYIDKKLSAISRLLQKHDDSVVCDVELREPGKHHTGPFYYAEINMEANGKLYRATAEKESYEAAIDEVKDELMRELRKDKTKKRTEVIKGATKAKKRMRGE